MSVCMMFSLNAKSTLQKWVQAFRMGFLPKNVRLIEKFVVSLHRF